VRNNADAEVDYYLWPGLTTSQKGSFTYKDWNGNSQWYMLKDASNNWALNSAVGGLDSFKAYQSTGSGDTYVNASNAAGVVRVNYESGSGAGFKVYGGNSSTLYASFTGVGSIAFPGLAASSAHNCLQIDTSGYVTNTGSACGTGSGGTVGSSNSGYIAYYTGTGSSIGGEASIPVASGGTGATTSSAALANLGALALAGGTMSGALNGTSASFAGNVAAGATTSGSVNGVYDLKAQFGASGSTQTMTCITTANSNVLTGCTGGDFQVGQWIFIPSAGLSPTLAPASGFTAACAVDYGASCTGSVTYSYEVVLIQGGPNGALTAPTPAVTVTQAAQTKFGGYSTPDVYTSLAWTEPANTFGALIYKSVNGGPYNYYTIVNGYQSASALKDYGNSAAANFTCTDIGVPCTVPAGATPNDVYAQISAINGSSYTISSYANQPQYLPGITVAASTYYPSTPSVSGTFTVQHDDSPALAAASLFFSAGHQGQLHIPAGTYMVHVADGSATNLTGRAPIRPGLWKHVTWAGDGYGTTQFKMSNDRSGEDGNFIFAECGDTTGGCSSYRLGSGVGTGTAYALNDPVPAGSNTVTLSTPSQASTLPAGTYITIYDNVNTYPANMYAELNEVIGSNSTTGVLTLKYPTSKMYSASLTAPWTTVCPACSAQPSISPMVGGAEASDITFRDFSFDGPVQFSSIAEFDNYTVRDLDVHAADFFASSYSRHMAIINNKRVYEDAIGVGGPEGLFEGNAADTDIDVLGNNYITHGSTGNPYCIENTTNLNMKDNVMLNEGVSDSASCDVAGQGCRADWITTLSCWNFSFIDNTLNVHNANIAGVIQNGGGGTATITGNRIFVDSVGSGAAGAAASATALVSTENSGGGNPYFRVFGNDWIVPNNLTNNGAGTSAGPATIFGALYSLTLANQSGGVQFYPVYGQATVTTVLMTGNITDVNLVPTGGHIPNHYFAIAFVQPASGGPYTLPSSCGATGWGNGNAGGIDCPSGNAPVANPASGSTTLLWFYDDGTTVHLLDSNYMNTGMLADWASGATNGQVPVWNSATGKWTPGNPSSGGGAVVAEANLTGQSASISTATLYSTGASGYGLYRFSCTVTLTRAATSSSTLPQCNVLYTDQDSGTGQNLGVSQPSSSNTAGATGCGGTAGGGYCVQTLSVAANTNIQYNLTGYASSGATAMQYAVRMRLEYLGQ
jgi:hypothetical protein